MGDEKPAVRLEHISKTFGDNKVLEDVSLGVAAGEALCVLGRSGIGKSVTLKIIIRLLPADSGRIWIDGAEIQGLDSKKLADVRKKIGFLFQNAALFDSISVYENIAFPLRRHTDKHEDEIRKIVQEKLKEVDLEKAGNKMPSELSGGMSKRAGLARALCLDPHVLLVDEPRSGLDPITASEIYQLLRDLKEKRKVSLVVVTHDVTGTQHLADRYAVLDKGRIVACGTADELGHSDNGLVRELVSKGEA